MVEHHRQEEVVSGESFWNVILELKNRLSKYEFAQNRGCLYRTKNFMFLFLFTNTTIPVFGNKKELLYSSSIYFEKIHAPMTFRSLT